MQGSHLWSKDLSFMKYFAATAATELQQSPIFSKDFGSQLKHTSELVLTMFWTSNSMLYGTMKVAIFYVLSHMIRLHIFLFTNNSLQTIYKQFFQFNLESLNSFC